MIPQTQTQTDTTAPEPKGDLVPNAYLAVRRFQVCACCGHRSEWTEVFARGRGLSSLKQRWVQLWQRTSELRWNVPLLQVPGKSETLPFCSWCNEPQVDPNLDLPTPVEVVAQPGKVIGLFKPEAGEAPTPKVKPSAPTSRRRPAATLDDLAAMME